MQTLYAQVHSWKGKISSRHLFVITTHSNPLFGYFEEAFNQDLCFLFFMFFFFDALGSPRVAPIGIVAYVQMDVNGFIDQSAAPTLTKVGPKGGKSTLDLG